MFVGWLTWKYIVSNREAVALGQGAITVPPRPAQSIVVIRGSARRVFGQVSSVIRKPATSFKRHHGDPGDIEDK